MIRIFPKMVLFSVISFIFLSCSFSSDDHHSYSTKYRNTILIIADGMGPEQVKAAGYFQYGQTGQLSFETFPYQTVMTTYSLDSSVTDSAAAATAMATGRKVQNGVLSQEPGTLEDLPTILEIASEEGKLTGLVTTTLSVHATPAAFASHVMYRYDYDEIARQLMEESRPDVILGGGYEGLSSAVARYHGYRAVEDLAELQNLKYTEGVRYFGYFGTGYMPYMYDGVGNLPELSDMALKALELLVQGSKGFFLMIEAGRIDHAGHENDLKRNIYEVLELSDTVEKVAAWAAGREDTIIIVTADHETGGLKVLQNKGAGTLPDVSWSTVGHTGVDVPVYIMGTDAEKLVDQIEDNRDIFYSLVGE